MQLNLSISQDISSNLHKPKEMLASSHANAVTFKYSACSLIKGMFATLSQISPVTWLLSNYVNCFFYLKLNDLIAGSTNIRAILFNQLIF